MAELTKFAKFVAKHHNHISRELPGLLDEHQELVKKLEEKGEYLELPPGSLMWQEVTVLARDFCDWVSTDEFSLSPDDEDLTELASLSVGLDPETGKKLPLSDTSTVDGNDEKDKVVNPLGLSVAPDYIAEHEESLKRAKKEAMRNAQWLNRADNLQKLGSASMGIGCIMLLLPPLLIVLFVFIGTLITGGFRP